ncbi:MAG: hypothetical protein ACI4TM_02620 [Candidatus Cryptobacteroides sp.]
MKRFVYVLLAFAALFICSCQKPAQGTDNGPADEDNYDGIEANLLYEAYYSTDNIKANGNYTVIFSNDELDNNTGYPANVGGLMMILNLYAEPDKDPLNAVIPSGEYSPNNDYSPFSFYPSTTICIVKTGEGNSDDDYVMTPATGGAVTVSREGNEYTILCDLMLFSGEEVSVRYKGSIAFVQTGFSDQKFDSAQNITFTKLEARYYGNWYYPHADDLTLRFYTGNFAPNGDPLDGYFLNLPVFMEKLPDPMTSDIVIQEGTYSIVPQKSAIYQIPFTSTMGERTDIFGQVWFLGTHVVKVMPETGTRAVGLITSGTYTVARNGNGYDFSFDLYTEEGISIKASFSGNAGMVNKCNNESMPEKPWSSLSGDRILSFSSDVVCEAYYMGDALGFGRNSWMLNFVPEKTACDMITLEFLAPISDGFSFKPGTYTISSEFKDYGIFPGFIEYGGQLCFAWYGDLTTCDSDGVASVLAPLTEGTMNVSAGDADNFTFSFDFKDDNGHSITGSWTGPVTVIDYSAEM